MKTLALLLALSLPAQCVMQYRPDEPPPAGSKHTNNRANALYITAGVLILSSLIFTTVKGTKKAKKRREAIRYQFYASNSINGGSF